ncbi:glycosyltransferase family 4 protein [Candidatus Campbellbacteria bacterium]|nr:MAG: glycosyltransferase family 4 protein [Candidatus Campbellbacteria bacterium]
MRLLLVTQVLDTEHPILGFFHAWIEEFAKHCESVIVICLQEGTYALPQNVRVLSLGKEEGVSRIEYLRRFFRYIYNERNSYDSVFVHMNQIYVVLGGVLWRLWKKKITLWYAHGSVPALLRFAVLFVHVVFTSTPQGLRLETSKKCIVGQGIDATLFDFRAHRMGDELNLITVGRVSPVKDLETIIDTVGVMHTNEAHCLLSIVGDAETASQHTYKHSIIERIKNREIEAFVTWRGSQSHAEIAHSVGRADVFIHSSRTGSLDKVVLEALAVGTLPVTCDPTLAHDLPDDLKRVCCVPSGDVQAYVRALMYIRALSSDESDRLRKKGREYVIHNHSLTQLIPKILDGIEKITF